MSIVSDSEILNFFGRDGDYFEINASINLLYFKYDAGSATAVTISNGTYSTSTIVTQLKSKIDTAFAISSTVAYSTTVRKFTIAVSTGHTIQYINTGSTAGLTFGFSEDSLDNISIVSDLESDNIEPVSMIINFKDWTEKVIKKYCRREFESATYSLERYNGTGSNYLFLRQYPIISLDRIAIGVQNVMRVRNTNTYSTASISVTSTGIRLVKDGVADETVTFAANTTLNSLASAISLISGWQCEVISPSIYGNYKSTELLPCWGLSTIDNNWVDLLIPDEGEYAFYDLNASNGKVYRSIPWPEGFRNVCFDYVAGYSSANMPDDLKLAITIITKHLYKKWQREEFGIDKYMTDDMDFTFTTKDFPSESMIILNKYKKKIV